MKLVNYNEIKDCPSNYNEYNYSLNNIFIIEKSYSTIINRSRLFLMNYLSLQLIDKF